jgi:serine/threonine-protein kinase RsbW
VNTIRLEFSSTFEMLDLVQVVSDGVGRLVGLGEDDLHWVGVAVRESVINAIKHGNHSNEAKLVFVEFTTTPSSLSPELVVLVRDQGEGFDPGGIRDPLAPENLLNSSGRGIFFMRCFMDDVVLRRVSGGGMEVRMVKKLSKAPSWDPQT